jgi:sugar phosphate isomerase/epimerase
MTDKDPDQTRQNRRLFLKNSAFAFGALASGAFSRTVSAKSSSILPQSKRIHVSKADNQKPTRFIHACMTLPYRNYSFERAIKGIKKAGYDYVAWGTTHRGEDGEPRPVIAEDAHPDQAAELGQRCRDIGLEPVQMFSTVYPDHDNAVQVLTNRIRQASAGRVDKVLVFGPTDGGNPELWVRKFRELAPIAADYNVMLVLKQHGGETTGTGEALAKIIHEVDHSHILMSYDAGNVFWYLEEDPIEDIQTCADLVRGFCLKDGRSWPAKTTGGPGYGEIDHYRLMQPIAFTGLTIPLTYENIYPPYLGGPESAKQVDEWARQALLYMENVVKGIQEV